MIDWCGAGNLRRRTLEQERSRHPEFLVVPARVKRIDEGREMLQRPVPESIFDRALHCIPAGIHRPVSILE